MLGGGGGYLYYIISLWCLEFNLSNFSKRTKEMSQFGMPCYKGFLISCLLLARRLIKHRFGKLRQTNCHSLPFLQ
jgi:hypothetical protein